MFIESKSGKVALKEQAHGKSVAILSHGYLSNKDSRTNLEVSRLLNQAGISTISYDMYGHGESEGDIEHLTTSKAVDSLNAVYDYAASRYEKIGLDGSSFTGPVSLIVASQRQPDVIALKCPVFLPLELWKWRLGENGIKEWQRKGYLQPFSRKWHYDVYEDAKKYDMRRIAAAITSPALVVHGNLDATVHISHAENLIFSLGSEEKRLVVVEGADHFFRDPEHFRKMSAVISGWITDHLGSQ
ncbi:prolyl oligopeptidase family serine peptidase [Candidatus Micrarchaeota archaeon]|nr:prolyl oligopeptidase family serine peptidase [Candidatus Micrarchaeota archaeon]